MDTLTKMRKEYLRVVAEREEILYIQTRQRKIQYQTVY